MLGEAQNLISWVPGDEVWDQVGDLYLHHILIFCSVRNSKWQNGKMAGQQENKREMEPCPEKLESRTKGKMDEGDRNHHKDDHGSSIPSR